MRRHFRIDADSLVASVETAIGESR
jgi:hypothetical protein